MKKSDLYMWNAIFRRQNYAEYKTNLALHLDFGAMLIGVFELYVQVINSSPRTSAASASSPALNAIAQAFCDASYLQTHFTHSCSVLDWYCGSTVLGLNKNFTALNLCSNQSSFSIPEYPRADFLNGRALHENRETLMRYASNLHSRTSNTSTVTELIPALAQMASIKNMDLDTCLHRSLKCGLAHLGSDKPQSVKNLYIY